MTVDQQTVASLSAKLTEHLRGLAGGSSDVTTASRSAEVSLSAVTDVLRDVAATASIVEDPLALLPFVPVTSPSWKSYPVRHRARIIFAGAWRSSITSAPHATDGFDNGHKPAYGRCVGTVVFGDFEWDAAKASANRAKHAVAFEEAAEAMLDTRRRF